MLNCIFQPSTTNAPDVIVDRLSAGVHGAIEEIDEPRAVRVVRAGTTRPVIERLHTWQFRCWIKLGIIYKSKKLLHGWDSINQIGRKRNGTFPCHRAVIFQRPFKSGLRVEITIGFLFKSHIGSPINCSWRAGRYSGSHA